LPFFHWLSLLNLTFFHCDALSRTAILILQTSAFVHYNNIAEDIFKHEAEDSRRNFNPELSKKLPQAISNHD
jgi:hypothetical protein